MRSPSVSPAMAIVALEFFPQLPAAFMLALPEEGELPQLPIERASK